MNGAESFREALERSRSSDAALLLVGFTVVGVATVFARQTLLSASLEQYLALGGDPGGLPAPPEDLRPVPLALGLSYGAALLAMAGTTVAREYLTVVTLRAFVGESLREAATRRVGRSVAAGFLVGVVVRALVVVGLVAFVLPGAFLAVSFLFAHARVAIEDDGPLTALREAWSLASGRRFAILSVVSVLLALYLVPVVLSSFVPDRTSGLLVGGLLSGPIGLLSSAVVARAYVGFREETAEEEEDEEEEDPYAQALGPDDLPEP